MDRPPFPRAMIRRLVQSRKWPLQRPLPPRTDMRKTIATTNSLSGTPHRNWLDLEHLAQVEVTSEGAAHPIESALRAGDPGAWCASKPGVQTIRLHFEAPQSLERIRLVVDET